VSAALVTTCTLAVVALAAGCGGTRQQGWPGGKPLDEGFFVASRHDVSRFVVESGPFGRFPGIEIRSITQLEVAKLGELLGAGRAASLLGPMSRGTRKDSVARCGVFEVLPSIRDGLARGDPTKVASRWAETPELYLARWTKQDAGEVLVSLHGLAGQARDERKQLWVRSCLS
jgi:hypothetical protein